MVVVVVVITKVYFVMWLKYQILLAFLLYGCINTGIVLLLLSVFV